MTKMKISIAAVAAIAMLLLTAACAISGKVEQGRTIAYDQKTGMVTLIADAMDSRSGPGVPAAHHGQDPADPDEMGPAPVPGKLIVLDRKRNKAVFSTRSRVRS